jgi:hypothetical protein
MKYWELKVGITQTYSYLWESYIARENHVPVLIHVNELTQPQGHSSSGSHERYKDANRLAWEEISIVFLQMKLWMIAINIASRGNWCYWC